MAVWCAGAVATHHALIGLKLIVVTWPAKLGQKRASIIMQNAKNNDYGTQTCLV